jgi:hypothetical protein
MSYRIRITVLSFSTLLSLFAQTVATLETSFRSDIPIESGALEIRINTESVAGYTVAISPSVDGLSAHAAQVPPRILPAVACPSCGSREDNLPKPLPKADLESSAGLLWIKSWRPGHVPVVEVKLRPGTLFSITTRAGEVFRGTVRDPLIVRNGILSKVASVNFGQLVLERSLSVGNVQSRLAEDEMATLVFKERLKKFETVQVSAKLAGKHDIAIIRLETTGRVTFLGSVFKTPELSDAASKAIAAWEATPYHRNGSMVAVRVKIPFHVDLSGNLQFAVTPN